MKTKTMSLILALIIALPVSAEIKEVPNGVVDASAYNAYQVYLKEKDSKAYAVSNKGAWGWKAQQNNKVDAINQAITSCNDKQQGKCDVIDVNGHLTTNTVAATGFLEKKPISPERKLLFPDSIQEIHKAEKYRDLYLTAPGNKAYATSESGAIGWIAQRVSLDDAKKTALNLCEKYNAKTSKPCELVDINGEILSGTLSFKDVFIDTRLYHPFMTAELNYYVDLGIYQTYKKMMGHKALAVAPTGYRHMSSMMTTLEYAKNAVLQACSKSAGEPCKLVLYDRTIDKAVSLENRNKDKPWLGRYLVDLTFAPHLIDQKDSLPFFTFTEKDVTITVDGKVAMHASYFQRDRLLTIFYRGKFKRGTFSEDYKLLILNDENKSHYKKAED